MSTENTLSTEIEDVTDPELEDTDSELNDVGNTTADGTNTEVEDGSETDEEEGTKAEEKASYILVNDEDPFADAEPYHYGAVTDSEVDSDYYAPITEDTNTGAPRIQPVLDEDKNGYSTIKFLNGFKIDKKPIKYIKAGTFPIAREQELTSIVGNYGNQANCEYCRLIVEYNQPDENGGLEGQIGDIKKIKLMSHAYNANITDEKLIRSFANASKDDDRAKIILYDGTLGSEHPGLLSLNEIKHGNIACPTRLGFVLVGAGGGAGGGIRVDPDKNKGGSSADYLFPGGGGGGGEIVWGVLDISYDSAKAILKDDAPTELIYDIKIGNGGGAGFNRVSSDVAEGGSKGDPGGEGNASIIYAETHTIDKEGNSQLVLNEVVKAYGGGGGGCATWINATTSPLGYGGVGGDGSKERDYLLAARYGCTIRGEKAGGEGGSPTGTKFDTAEVKNTPLQVTIYFSKTDPTKWREDYCIRRNHETYTTTYPLINIGRHDIFNTPGGHSFGRGARVRDKESYDSIGTAWEAQYDGGPGGGGCCSGDTDYWDSAGPNSYGNGGFFGLYY